MPTTRRVEEVLNLADQLVRVWEGNPDFKLADVTIRELKTAANQLRAVDGSVARLESQLLENLNDRDSLTSLLDVMLTQVSSAIRSVYGPDSTQYGQVLRNRAGERKKPAPKETAKVA